LRVFESSLDSMMTYTADLHIHSRYSRATSKTLSIPSLAAWAGVKGVDILSTSDFTHSGWLEEIKTHLEENGDGLLRLKDPACMASQIPWLDKGVLPQAPLFILGTEISSIYKSQGQVRKIHNLVFFSSLDRVRSFNRRLGQVGNLESDGRPILGLDSRDLLEMVLEADPLGFLIPAHIWTPWFSLFGSKSGFNRLADCYRDLSQHIFALETGLSSDPEMNWLWSGLDAYTLVSNSDAHSGEKLAREANVFSGQPTYEHIMQALQKTSETQRFLGSIEFFPEEGKYHLDGHRKCGIVLDPRETTKLGGICPVCGGKLTVGVLNRVLDLADRDTPCRPEHAPGFVSLIPLPEMLAEILGKGPRTKTVTSVYAQLIQALGSELDILRNTPPEEVKPFSSVLAEGLSRMRRQEVRRKPGFDGEFGQISVFTPEEMERWGQGRFSCLRPQTASSLTPDPKKGSAKQHSNKPAQTEHEPLIEEQNDEQRQAVRSGPHPVLILAGPGTGKTKTLIGRVKYLLDQGIDPASILVVTFTRAAARELQERLQSMLPPGIQPPRADTLHALAFEQWKARLGQPPVLMSEQEARTIFARSNPELTGPDLSSTWEQLSKAREQRHMPAFLCPYEQAFAQYKKAWNLADYTDLLSNWLDMLQTPDTSPAFSHLLVDEIQDLSELQGELIGAMLPADGTGFFGIGDPNQSIYGFRGAIGQVQEYFSRFWPNLATITLHRNYRSSQEILDFSSKLCPLSVALQSHNRRSSAQLMWYQAESEAQEAIWIAGQIHKLIGGTGHLQADLSDAEHLAPSEIAVLVRLKALMPPLQKALEKQGVPCAVPESTPFWQDERVQRILGSAARFLGIPYDQCSSQFDCPEKILIQGPREIAVQYGQSTDFDHPFWSSQAYKDLCAAFDHSGDWINLLAWIQLEAEAADIRQKSQKVRLLTMHAAKGLEFKAVFLPALEQGILPFAGTRLYSGKSKISQDGPDLEEERRLLYVGLTRAESQLFLSCAKRRRVGPVPVRLSPSNFLSELDWTHVSKIHTVVRTRKREKQLSLLDELE